MAMRALLFAALLGTAQVVATGAQQHVAAGDGKLAAGDAAGAADEYRAAVAADPTLFAARVNLGAALLRLGDVQGAIDSLEAARKVDANSAPLLRSLGRAYLRAERWDDAASALEAAAAIEPDHPDLPRLRGIALARSGHAADAVPLLRQALAAAPKDLELAVELASAETDAGDPAAKGDVDRARKAAGGNGTDAAREHNLLGLLLRRQGRMDDSLDEFRAAAHADPTYAPALANLGEALLDAGHAKEAVGTLDAAAKRDPDPEIVYARGQAKLAAGDPKGAIADLEEARSWGYDPNRIAAALVACYEAIGEKSKADGERSRAGGATGMAIADADARAGADALAKGRWAEAADRLGKAAEKKPDDGPTQFDLGLARLHLGDSRGAIAPLEAASHALPKEPLVWYHLGIAKDGAGDAAGAIDAWSTLLSLDAARADVEGQVGHLLLTLHRDSEAAARLAHAHAAQPKNLGVDYDLAVALTRLHRETDAIPPLEAYLAARPDDADVRDAYAHALADSGHAREAAAQYAKLASAEPSVARHLVNEAVCWRNAKEPEKEKSTLLAAAALAPDDAAVLADLGRLQFQDKEWAKAADSFSRAAKLDPSMADAAKNAETARHNADVETQKASRLHLGVIVAKTRLDADGALAKIRRGKESFADAAKAISTHDSAKNGGDLGWVDPATLPAWAAAAKTLAPGKTSDVLAVPGGFAIFVRYAD